MSLIAQQPPKAAGKRPTGLHLSNCTDSSCLQHQAASNSQAEPASRPLLVTNLRPLSATAAAAACSSSPKGQRSSACPSPKLPKASTQTAAAAAAQLKGQQRTPLPLILARMKMLLERLHMLSPDGACASAAQSPKPQRPATPKAPAAASFFLPDSSPGAAATTTTTSGSSSSSTPGARAQRGTDRSSWGAKPGRKPAKGLIEVSTTGGLGQSVMQQSAQSILDELDVILGFISEFLQSLPADTRRALATVARPEAYKKDQLVFDIEDEPSHFYVILSGQIDIWTHPPGTHRPKYMVNVLRRGEAFGDQAIIHSEPHSTAASAATNVTLLVVDKQDFMTVLGSHFLDAAAEWQRFLVTHVTPLGDCDPAVMRRLCSTLVSDKPAAGQECDVHAEQIYFIQAGRFELRLIDLQAKQAAEAALAAAIASASSALPIAPIPEHLRLGAGGMHVGRGASSRRPASAPPRAHRPVPVSDASSAAAAAAAAAAVPAAGEGAGGSQGAAAAGGPLGASVAAGLDLLQAGLADCPAMGAEGVLASVRVKNGRLVGTQGLAEQLRQQHNLLAELGPGGWFGGGQAIYGAGPLQAALQVVAVGPDCVVLHAHLSGLSKHGGPGLLKKLRDDAAFKVTYYLGRVGVLPPLGMAVGHPDSTLVSEAAETAAAAAALEAASMSARGPGGATAGPLLAAPAGHRAGSASRSRPASACPAAAAVAVTGGGGVRSRVSNAASSRPQSAAAAAVATGGGKAAACSRPVSATQKGGSRGGATALRRSSSANSCVSTAWDDAQIGVMPPAAGGAASTAAAPQVARAETAGAAAAAAVAAPPGAHTCSLVMTGSFLPKASRVRQKHVHVPGSGVFSPGVMAALQHVSALQAAGAAVSAAHDTASSSTHSTLDQPSALPAAAAATAALGAGSCGQAAPGGGHQSTARRSTLFQPSSTAAGAGSILDDAASTSDSASSSIALGSAGCRARPRSAGVRACTAADVFWAQPEHSATATGTALSGLLSSLFSDGLQPLVTELDCLLSHAVCTQNTPLLLQQQQQQLQPQRCTPLTQQQPQAPQQPALWHASAAGRLQRPMSSPEAAPGKTALSGGQRQPSQQPQQQQQQCGRGYHGQQQELPDAGLLRHKPETSLLAASVMYQRSSEAAFRPPLRQCLTSEEVARCRIAGSTDGCGDVGVL